jgi:hypothetical protein
MIAGLTAPETAQLCCCLIPLIRGRSFPEAAAPVALFLGKGEELRPGHARGHDEGAQYFQHVGELAGEVAGGGVACLRGLFDELGQQRLAVARLIEDPDDWVAACGLDDLGIRSRTSFRLTTGTPATSPAPDVTRADYAVQAWRTAPGRAVAQ